MCCAAAPLSQHERLAHIRRVHTDEVLANVDLVLALLILLYAQPLIRIARLTIDDVIRNDDQVLSRLRDLASPVPQAFARNRLPAPISLASGGRRSGFRSVAERVSEAAHVDARVSHRPTSLPLGELVA